MNKDLAKNLKSLGSDTVYKYKGGDAKLLEAFDNPAMRAMNGQDNLTIVITAPEFTSLCPKTGQPDFATIIIDYTPLDLCVESKSLKLYLGSFRQLGMFHEACVDKICKDLAALLKPARIKVVGQFSPRGGISFWPTSVRFYPKR